MTAPTMPAPSGQKAGSAKAPVALRPFKVGVQNVDDQPYDVSVTLTASAQNLTPQYEIPSTGYLKHVYVLVEAACTGNTAAVTFDEDAPFNVISSITFTDTNNAEIVGPITGWDLYVINKYGGYTFSDDPKASPTYAATTGSGTSATYGGLSGGGSFKFCLRIPVELVPRDALGALPNKSSSTPFKVKTVLSDAATVYNQAPTNNPSVRTRMVPKSYWEPTPTDGSGNPVAPNPPGVNTTQYWNKTDYTVNAGSFNTQLTNSTGFPVRNLVFVLRDSNGSRATGETDFPDPFKLQTQSNIIVDRIKQMWQRQIAEDYDYGLNFGSVALPGVGDYYVGPFAAVPTANSVVPRTKDNAVYVLPFCKDFGPKPGWENRREYLRTTDGMRLQALGTIGGTGTHTLTVFTNYVGLGAGTTLAALTT